MADEYTDRDQKTQRATPKRLQQAREEGQIAQSREVATFALLLAAFIVVIWMAPPMMREIVETVSFFIVQPDQIRVDESSAQSVILRPLLAIGTATGLAFAFLVFVALMGTMLQTDFYMSTKKLKFDLKNLSFKKGIKRLVSMNSLVELVRSLIKFIVVGGVAIYLFVPLTDELPYFIGADIGAILNAIRDEAFHILVILLLIVGLMAAADWFYQRFTYFRDLRMTKQEVKDEYKQMEGDPKIKNKLRQVRMERSRKRMMARVPQADVVITNPTHYAVALQYDNETMQAPILVAKGADNIALKIREVAQKHDVPIISNPPLARTLYDSLDIDQPIKTEHYKAVAEVISFVFKLKKKPQISMK